MWNLTKLTLGIGFTFLAVSTAQAQLYRITDLGTLPGGMTSEAAAINDHGQVVGAASVPQGTHAFLWTRSRGMQDLGSLPGGGSYSYAVGINHGGMIAGSSDFTQPYTGNTHAFLWTRSSGMRDLGTLGCPDITGATGINFFRKWSAFPPLHLASGEDNPGRSLPTLPPVTASCRAWELFRAEISVSGKQSISLVT
jgi:probable HAF family extracellular repeat protein